MWGGGGGISEHGGKLRYLDPMIRGPDTEEILFRVLHQCRRCLYARDGTSRSDAFMEMTRMEKSCEAPLAMLLQYYAFWFLVSSHLAEKLSRALNRKAERDFEAIPEKPVYWLFLLPQTDVLFM